MKQMFAVLLISTLPVKADTFGDWNYYIDDNGEATITGLTAPAIATISGAVTIPSEVGGFPVTIIQSQVDWDVGIFGDNTNITSVAIPNSVKEIGPYAFANTKGLTNVVIPSSVTRIDGVAFAGCTGLTNIIIPNSVTFIGYDAFRGCTGLTSVTIPNSVTRIQGSAFYGCTSITNITMPDRFLAQVGNIIDGNVSTEYLVNSLANNDAFVTAVANKILAASNNYGLATQSGVSNTITATTSNLVTQSEILTLATKTELTNALAQSRTDGINSVLSNPNLWTLYTTNQIKNLAIGDLVLTQTNGSGFVLNYDIEQSEDLVNWTPYQGFAMPLTNLPTNKAFVRIKAKQ